MLAGAASLHSLELEMQDRRAVMLTLLAFGFGAATRAYGGLHLSYLCGVGRIALARWCEAGCALVSFCGALLVVLTGGDILLLAAVYQGPLVANILLNGLICRQDQMSRPGFLRQWRLDRRIFGQLWPGVWRTGLGSAFYLGSTQGVGLYFATIGDPSQVAAFLFAMSLIRPVGQFAQVPFFTKVPTLARLQASGGTASQRAISERGMRQSHALFCALVLGIGAALPLLTQMRGGTFEVPLHLWLMIGLAGCLERVGAMHLQLYASTSRILMHWANGIASVVFVGLSWLIFPWLAVLAFPVAQSLALLLVYIPISLFHSYREFGLRFPGFEFRTSFLPLCLLLGACMIALHWHAQGLP